MMRRLGLPVVSGHATRMGGPWPRRSDKEDDSGGPDVRGAGDHGRAGSRVRGPQALRDLHLCRDGVAPILASGEPHLAHQAALERDGVMFGAGPLLTADGEWFDGDGMVIVLAPSLEADRAIEERDPMHVNGARRFEIRPRILNEGSIRLSVSLSDGRGLLE
jgi:uncharacterized protein YciI